MSESRDEKYDISAITYSPIIVQQSIWIINIWIINIIAPDVPFHHNILLMSIYGVVKPKSTTHKYPYLRAGYATLLFSRAWKYLHPKLPRPWRRATWSYFLSYCSSTNGSHAHTQSTNEFWTSHPIHSWHAFKFSYLLSIRLISLCCSDWLVATAESI